MSDAEPVELITKARKAGGARVPQVKHYHHEPAPEAPGAPVPIVEALRAIPDIPEGPRPVVEYRARDDGKPAKTRPAHAGVARANLNQPRKH